MSGRVFGAIVLAAVAHFLLGALWFTALSDTWLHAIGKTREELLRTGSAGLAYSVAFICNLLIAYGIYRVNVWGDQRTAASGALTGLLLGACLVAAAIVTEFVFEARSLQAMAVIAGYPVVGMTMMGAIVGAVLKSG